MAVRHQYVEPAVVIHVEEANSPAKQTSINAEAARVCPVFKRAVAQIGVKRIGVAGEVGLCDVKIAVAIVVADRDAHAGLRFAFGRESCARLDRDVLESSVFLVLIKRGRARIVRDVDVRPSVIIEIGSSNAQPIGAACVPDTGLFTDVGEGAIAIVVIQNVFAAG